MSACRAAPMGRPDLEAMPAEAQRAIAHCFGCGDANPHGLRLTATHEGDVTVVAWQPSQAHAGWDTVVHGGLLATLIDEVAAFAMFDGFKEFGMTRSMKVTYLRRVHWTKPVRAEARLRTRDAGRAVFDCRVLQDGIACTEGEVEFRLLAAPPPRGA